MWSALLISLLDYSPGTPQPHNHSSSPPRRAARPLQLLTVPPALHLLLRWLVFLRPPRTTQWASSELVTARWLPGWQASTFPLPTVQVCSRLLPDPARVPLSTRLMPARLALPAAFTQKSAALPAWPGYLTIRQTAAPAVTS